MSFARPFAYNPGSLIPGTEQIGELSIGFPISGFTDSPQYWNGPDEDLGYVIAAPVSGNTQPTPVTTNRVYLSPTYKGTDIQLSNNNQTASQLFGYQQSVLGVNPIGTTDKVMFSVLCTLADPGAAPDSHFVGVGYTSMNYQGNPYDGFPGNDNQSMGYGSSGTIWYNGNVYQGGLQTWGNNDIIDIVVDNNTNDLWVRVNGGNWNNNPSANPATGSNAIETIGGPFYPVLCPGYEGTMIIQNSPVYSVPSGYNFLATLASVGFYGTETFDNTEFINLAEIVSNEYGNPQTFSSSTDASVWLRNNGFWNSYQNGITLQLDASNNTSYPGFGNIWYDLVSPQQNITLVNSPNFTPTSPSYFSFNGSGAGQYGTGVRPVLSATAYTKSIWFYLNSYQDNNLLSSQEGGHFMYMQSTNKIYCGHTDWPDFSAFPSNFDFQLNTWYYVALTFNTTDGMKLYVNGILDSVYTANKSPIIGNLSTNVAAYGTGNELSGRIARVFCYNISLSDAEVLQNYDDTKEPFIPVTPTPTPTNTITPTPTSTLTATPTNTASVTPTNTPTPSITTTQTPTNTETPTNTPSITTTQTPTNTETPTNTPSITTTQTPTNTETPTQTPTNTETPTNTPSETPTQTPTNTETPTNTPTPTAAPISRAWSAGGSLITARRALAGAGTQNAGLAFGGYVVPSGVSCTEEYNGTSWTAGGSLINGRYGLAGAGTQNAGLAFGGFSGSCTLSLTEEYDGSSWSAGGALIQRRNALAGEGTQNEALAFGGRVPFVVLSSTEEYNGLSWSTGGALITARYSLAGAGTQNAGLAFGGFYPVTLSCTEEYNGTSWSAGGYLITGRSCLAGAGTQNAGLAFGGASALSCTEEYNGSSWTAGGALIDGRCGLGGAGTQTAGLAFGGFTSVELTCTEEYS